MSCVRLLFCFAVVGLGTASCGSELDPCAKHDGHCISARVEGSLGGLDQLTFSLDGQPAKPSPSIPTDFSLPVAVALVLPETTTAESVTVTVTALSDGQTVATDSQKVELDEDKTGWVDFALKAPAAE